MSHILVIANETAASRTLLEAVRGEAGGDDRVTVVAPVNEPRQGYVVYEDSRRASAGRRLERSLHALREAGLAADGFVADCGPVQATRDAIATLEPPVDKVVVSTHAPERSGWMRRDVVAEIERAAGGIPVRHVVADDESLQKNVLVIANRTVLSADLLARIRKRAANPPVGFLIVAPQEDVEGEDETAAARRLRRALSELRGEGINAHGQIVHPDPYTAAMHALNDERVDELIVSTFPNQKSGWLRRDLVDRLRKDTGLPVEHVIDTRTREEVPA